MQVGWAICWMMTARLPQRKQVQSSITDFRCWLFSPAHTTKAAKHGWIASYR